MTRSPRFDRVAADPDSASHEDLVSAIKEIRNEVVLQKYIDTLDLEPGSRRTLLYMCLNEGRVVSRDVIAKLSRGTDIESDLAYSTNTPDVRILRLRKSMIEAKTGIDIVTIRGKGFRLKIPVDLKKTIGLQ